MIYQWHEHLVVVSPSKMMNEVAGEVVDIENQSEHQ